MRKEVEPDRVTRALRDLPRERVSADFTRQVLEEVQAIPERPASRPAEAQGPRSWALAAGVLALVGAAALAGYLWGPGADRPVAELAESMPLDTDLLRGRPVPATLDLATLEGLPRDEQVQMLRSRMHSLQAELEELRRLADYASPVVHLGSSETLSEDPFDVLLDLRALVPADPLAVRTSTQGANP